MKILFVGEIVASLGRKAVRAVLPEIISNDNIDLVIANVENLAGGRGATKETLDEIASYGVQYFTGGDHIFWREELEDHLMELPLVCPANYPEPSLGKLFEVANIGANKVVILNLMGRTFLNENLDSPFSKLDYLLNVHLSSIDLKDAFIVVDFHAEASSEKSAFANYADGRVGAVVGTHTHIPSADPQILPKGTLFISDVGMSGAANSVLGVKTDIVIKKYLSARNQRFEWEETGPAWFRSVIIDTDKKSIARCDRFIESF